VENYLDLLESVADYGQPIETRNGTRITSYGAQLRFDLTSGFPLVTTRHIPWKNPTTEICWFLRGDTDISFLHQHNVHIWDANADAAGNVGHSYGYMWRHGFGFDQITNAVEMLKKTPKSTRNMVYAWHPAKVGESVLPPCHMAFQLHSEGHNLTLQYSQRSCDLVLGAPTNIAGYAILCHLFAQVTGQRAVEVIADLGNVHIYADHMEGVRQQLQREPTKPPEMRIIGDVRPDLFDLDPSQFLLSGYEHHPAIKFNMSV
jgi:thymidylate synthase